MAEQEAPQEEFGTQFDAETQKNASEKINKLKKANIKAVFGTGVGRISLIVVSCVFLFFMAFGLYQLSKKSAPTQGSSAGSNAVLNNHPAQGDHTVATDEEASMRKATISAQAEDAKKSGTPFIAPPVLKLEEEAPKTGGSDLAPGAKGDQKSNAEADRVKMQGQPQQKQGQQNQSLLRQLDELAKARERLSKDEIMPQLLTILGRDKEGKNTTNKITTGYYALPDRTPQTTEAAVTNPATTQGASGPTPVASTAGKIPFISAGEGFYCQFDFGINTDASGKDVVGTCFQGKMKNARVIGKWTPSPDGAVDADVSVTFDRLAIAGKPTQAITAIAVNEETFNTGLADEVNDHTVKKFGGLFIASMLRGIGKAASIVTGQTSTVTTGMQTVQTTSVDPISASRQAKIALGELGVSASDVFQRRAETIKPTVKVHPKKAFGLVFLADLY